MHLNRPAHTALRVYFALIAVDAWGCGGGPSADAPVPLPEVVAPSILLITLDTTRADRLGAYGHSAAQTPNLDRLASQGLRFALAVSPTPLTIPSHASLFTGLYPPHHGVRDNGDGVLPDAADTLAERLQAGGYQTGAAVAAFVTQRHWGFGQGFDTYDDTLGVEEGRLAWRAERPAAAVVDAALLTLADQRRDPRPDFLWVHLFDAHRPYPAEPAAPGEPTDPYDRELAQMDREIGRLLTAWGSDEIIVVAGDHGEGLGEGGEDDHGLLLTPGVMTVPLLLMAPGVVPGVEARPVSLVDVMPTLLRLAGLPAVTGIDGHDLISPSSPSPGVYSETLYGTHHFGWAPLRSVTTGDGRLVRGARDEGTVQPAAVSWMEELAGASPSWAAVPVSLDRSQVEQLQALGYLGSPASTAAAGGPDPRDAIGLLSRLQARHKTAADAEAAIRAVIAEAPQMRDAHIRLANLLMRRGATEPAVAALTDAWLLGGDSTTALLLGDAWLQLGQPGEALQWLREAATLDPRSVDAAAGEVEALVMLGELDEAAALAELGLVRWAGQPRLHVARAAVALDRGEPVGEHGAVVLTMAQAHPDQPRVQQLAARLLVSQGDLQGAQERLETSLRWSPGDSGNRELLYALYREEGRLVDAVKVLRPMLALRPSDARWAALSAQAWLQMGRADRAAPLLLVCAGHPQCPPAQTDPTSR
jgi:choline-sulfatase